MTEEIDEITQQTSTPQDVQQTDTPNPADNEAAKYRRRLREVEAERDELRGHIAELQGEVVRQLLTGVLTDPADFDQVGIAAVLGDDGRIDRGKLDTAVTSLLESKPHYAPRAITPRTRPQPRPGVSAAAGATPQKPSKLDEAFPPGKTRWSDVMHKGERAAATETARKSATVQVSSDPGQ